MTQKEKNKALALENKGDTLVKKGKITQAIATYQKALQLTPDSLSLVDKLITTHEAKKEKWTEEDFVLHLDLTMKKQEVIDPAFKRYHARHDAECRTIVRLIQKMMVEKTQTKETEIVEEIVACGEKAVYPLVDALLALKQPINK